jgi:hypothetical protein
MATTLEQQKETAMRKLMEIKSARRGQVSEQYYERKTADGRTVKTGPYYVWQRWVKGQKISVRIPPEHLAQVREDLEKGREVQKIFDDLFTLMEQKAVVQDLDAKKKWSRRRTHGCAKRKQRLP